MKVNVRLDDRGMLPDAYGKYAARGDAAGRLCRRSFPFEVEGVPEGAQALAWVFLDWDSTPVCGFPWIHWCAQLELPTGASTGRVEVPDDASRAGMPGLAQGRNSTAKEDAGTATGYVGPCPPDRDHVYSLYVAALDRPCALAAPFWVNELVGASRGHVLAWAAAQLPSRS